MSRPGDYILVYFVDQVTDGYKFERRRLQWPLHITLIPWFFTVSSRTATDLDRILSLFAAAQQPVRLTVGATELFGSKNDLPVNLVVEHEIVRSLHLQLKQCLNEVGAQYQSEAFIGAAYRPRITQHGVRSAQEGSQLLLDHISLIKLLPDNVCRVVKTYELGYNSKHE